MLLLGGITQIVTLSNAQMDQLDLTTSKAEKRAIGCKSGMPLDGIVRMKAAALFLALE